MLLEEIVQTYVDILPIKKKIIIYIISLLIYYPLHMKFFSYFIISLLFIENPIIGNIIMLLFICIGVIITANIIFNIIVYKKTNKILYSTYNEFRIMYVIVLIIFLFFRGSVISENAINLNPFTILDMTGTNISLIVWICNITMFMPMCMLFPKVKLKNIILISILIEFVQLLTKTGIFDINDIMLYMIGYIIGKILLKNLAIEKYLLK